MGDALETETEPTVDHDFDVDRPVREVKQGPTFRLGGRIWQCMAEPPAWTRYTVLASIRGDLTVQVAAAIEFLQAIVIPSQEDALVGMLRSKDPETNMPFVDEDTLGKVFSWAVKEFVSPRPLSSRAGSSRGRKRAKDTSEADA